MEALALLCLSRYVNSWESGQEEILHISALTISYRIFFYTLKNVDILFPLK